MPTQAELSDLAQLHAVARRFTANIAIIGAAALQCFITLPRFTYDIDLVVALDLEHFAAFASQLQQHGWTQEPQREHRWHGPSGSIIDLVPAGPELRAAKQIVWPESNFVMSLIGFEHVFNRAVEIEFGPNARYRVAPPAVIALLKIVAYMDDQERHAKDLQDLRALLRHYESGTERIFADEVFAANLSDVEFANAFLLGLDVGDMTTDDEAVIINTFLQAKYISDEELADLDLHDDRDDIGLQKQLRAFQKGLAWKQDQENA